MTPEQKLAAGPELFDYACEITKAGIRMQNPGIDEKQVREILRARLDAVERREGIFTNTPPSPTLTSPARLNPQTSCGSSPVPRR
jgi:hypothetical protein